MPRVLVNLVQSTGTKGGIEIYARELYKQLGRMDTGYTYVALASAELSATDTSWFPGEVVDSGVSGTNRISWARAELFAVGRAATRLGADLLHGPAMFAPLRSPVPTVVSFHDVLYFSHPELMQNKLFTTPVKWMEQRAARTAQRIITISEYSSRGIQRYLKFPADRIDVIPLAGRANALGSAGRDRASDLFIAVGQRSPYKNFETVVRAWSHIPAESRPRLVITGSHGEDPLAPLVAQLGLEKWVELKSWVPIDELEQLFSTATALIDSTLATGFSMPTLEAMSVGLPVLLADTEVFREVGAGGADYFTAGDPVDLARAVTELAGDRARQLELAAAGVERSAQFSWERVAQETIASFDRALGR